MPITHKIRPGSRITGVFGHEIDPVVGGYRFHRALDRSGGDRLVYCPMDASYAILENPSSHSFGSLIRLIYDGLHNDRFEIRIAHCTDFNPVFLDLVKHKKPIPAGLVLASEGSLGKATGPHSHIELVVIGWRSQTLDNLLHEHGGNPNRYYSDEEIEHDTKSSEFRSWMKKFGASKLGPWKCVAWDWRNNCMSVWMDPVTTLGL